MNPNDAVLLGWARLVTDLLAQNEMLKQELQKLVPQAAPPPAPPQE